VTRPDPPLAQARTLTESSLGTTSKPALIGGAGDSVPDGSLPNGAVVPGWGSTTSECGGVRGVGPSGPNSGDVVVAFGDVVDRAVGMVDVLGGVDGAGRVVRGLGGVDAAAPAPSPRSTGPADADLSGGSGDPVRVSGRATHIPPASVPIANDSVSATTALCVATVGAEAWLIQCWNVSHGWCARVSVLAGTSRRYGPEAAPRMTGPSSTESRLPISDTSAYAAEQVTQPAR
jgi:hypothetical protein